MNQLQLCGSIKREKRLLIMDIIYKCTFFDVKYPSRRRSGGKIVRTNAVVTCTKFRAKIHYGLVSFNCQKLFASIRLILQIMYPIEKFVN